MNGNIAENVDVLKDIKKEWLIKAEMFPKYKNDIEDD